MSRKLTPHSSLDTLKREAKRWLKALRDGDPRARARLARVSPTAPASPGLRDVQHALALEHGFPGWTALKGEIARRDATTEPASRDAAVLELLAAAERGDAHRVSELLDAYADIINERAVLRGHIGQRTALHFAMNRSSEAVVDVLLAHGADPNVRDEGDNAMPLHFAAEHGSLDIVRRLIEHGADPIGAGDGHELEVIGWA
ncbi:MAG TPA: ankyrin repeat domain-containing protein, partial [Gemmatimonadaceae bacterium]|nr:ankyrin repeat domain-containing protein [Gemmatimonadaceae bacterium]